MAKESKDQVSPDPDFNPGSILTQEDAIKWAMKDPMDVAFVTEDKTTFLLADEKYALQHRDTFNLKLFKVK